MQIKNPLARILDRLYPFLFEQYFSIRIVEYVAILLTLLALKFFCENNTFYYLLTVKSN